MEEIRRYVKMTIPFNLYLFMKRNFHTLTFKRNSNLCETHFLLGEQ